MADVAVVAHAGKTLGGGLPELREILAREGVTDPLWYEVKKSRRAPKYARRAAAQGADVLFVWGGDGSVQRCIDAVAGTDTAVAILPAGTANLLAANLEVPRDLAEAVQVGLHGDRRRLDTGSVNGERFMVMAGAGFDARMIADADRGAKDRMGRAAYVVTGVRNLAARRARTTVKVDGKAFFKGKASCVLAANVGKILGGVEAFPQAQPDDGRLELGVVTARNPVEWARTFGRLAVGHPDHSPFVKVAQGKKISIRFDRKIRYELDGGARPATRKLRIKVRPASVTICVPPARLARGAGPDPDRLLQDLTHHPERTSATLAPPGSALVILETDQPVQAVPVDDLAVGCAPRPHLEVIDHPAALAEPGEPVLQGRGVGGAEQGQHQSLASQGGLVAGRVGGKEQNRAVDEVAMGDGLSRPVGPVEVFKRVQLGGAPEDISVKGQRLPGSAGKVEVRRRWRRRCHA